MNKPTLTIGIPAYNEAHTIGLLLSDLLRQQQTTYRLTRIIVVSDASTDKTARIVSNLKNPQITLVQMKKRCGQALSQNQILKKTRSDVLVLLNADVRIASLQCIERLIAPITKSTADLVSCRVTALPPDGWFERILFISTKMKESLYESLRGGNNIYTCHGRVRAFSRRFYSVFRFPRVVAEDAYSYLACKNLGFTYRYVKDASVSYRLPSHLADHIWQSARFFQSVKQLEQRIKSIRIMQEYAIPAGLIVRSCIAWTLRHPVEMAAYLLLAVGVKFLSQWSNYSKARWNVSESSKRLNIFISL